MKFSKTIAALTATTLMAACLVAPTLAARAEDAPEGTPVVTEAPVESEVPEESETPVESEQPEESEAPVESENPEESKVPEESEPTPAESPEASADPSENPGSTVPSTGAVAITGIGIASILAGSGVVLFKKKND